MYAYAYMYKYDLIQQIFAKFFIAKIMQLHEEAF